MILHYDFSKYLVPWMSPPCIAILLQTGDWPEFWYQHHFRYCRLDIAYKISKLFQRDQMLTTILVLCPCTWFSSAIGQFMKLRVPQHIPDHFHNPYPCVCNDWNVTARDCYWQCAMSDHSNSRVGLNFFYTGFLYVLNTWETKWITYTTIFFWSTSLIGRVSFILRLWCFKGTGV